MDQGKEYLLLIIFFAIYCKSGRKAGKYIYSSHQTKYSRVYNSLAKTLNLECPFFSHFMK